MVRLFRIIGSSNPEKLNGGRDSFRLVVGHLYLEKGAYQTEFLLPIRFDSSLRNLGQCHQGAYDIGDQHGEGACQHQRPIAGFEQVSHDS